MSKRRNKKAASGNVQFRDCMNSGINKLDDCMDAAAERQNAGQSIRTHVSQIKSGTLGSILLMAANIGLAMLVSILLARWLGPAEYGVYAFAMSICTLLAIPIQLGLPRLLVREVAKYEANEQWGLLKGIVRLANSLVFILTAIVLVMGVSAPSLMGGSQTGTRTKTIIWALVLLPVISLSSLRMAVLRGLRRVVIGQLPERLIQPIIVILLAGVYSFRQFDAADAMMLTCVAAGIGFAVGTWFLLQAMPSKVASATAQYDRKSWISSLLPLSMVSAVAILGGRSDIFLLGAFSIRDSDIGNYRVAIAASGLVSIALTAINVSLAPHVANLYSQGKVSDLQRIVTKCSLATVTSAALLTLVFTVSGRTILNYLYTIEYQDAYPPLVILSFGQLVSASAGSVALVLNMTGNERVVLRISVGAIVLNLVMNIVMIQWMGATGAAIATATSLAVANIALNLGARKATGIETSVIGLMLRPQTWSSETGSTERQS